MRPHIKPYLTVDEFIIGFSGGQAAHRVTLNHDVEAVDGTSGRRHFLPAGSPLIAFDHNEWAMRVLGVGFVSKTRDIASAQPLQVEDPEYQPGSGRLQTLDERRRSEFWDFVRSTGCNPADFDPPRAGDKPPGWIGDVEVPTKFASGASAPLDYSAMFAGGANLGITITEVSDPSMLRIATLLASNPEVKLFVDSGAYGVFREEQKEREAAAKSGAQQLGFDMLLPDLPPGGKTLDFTAVLQRYDALLHAVSVADEHGCGNATDRVFFVMPDIIGRQAESLDMIGRYRDKIAQWGDNAIIPLPGGEKTLKETYEAVAREMGYDNPADWMAPIIGIPTKANAPSDEQFWDLLAAYGDNIAGIHILGAAMNEMALGRLKVMKDAGFDGNVTFDANLARSFDYAKDRVRAFEQAIDYVKSVGITSKEKPPAKPRTSKRAA